MKNINQKNTKDLANSLLEGKNTHLHDDDKKTDKISNGNIASNGINMNQKNGVKDLNHLK